MPKNQKTSGRKPDANSKSGRIRSLLATGASASAIAKKLGCTPALVYNVRARMGGAAPKRGPGRPPKAAAKPAMSSLGGIEGILAVVKNAEQQRTRLRGALERIHQLVTAALD